MAFRCPEAGPASREKDSENPVQLGKWLPNPTVPRTND